MNNNFSYTYAYNKKDGYTEHRFFEEDDAYGQHSGRITDGWFKKEDIVKDGKNEWAFNRILIFKDAKDAQSYADMAVYN